ncbi:galactose oxidase [Wilcoxina mikolae CBS 423.85]|nr:galactose oxidase [Wilcoxina mikolae CBS 423.85]
MAKKDKKKTPDKKARVAEKAARKSAQKEKKVNKKAPAGNIVDADDQDIDAVLEEYARRQAQFHKVTETLLDSPPPVRSGATLTPSPANSNELFLFAGETFNGSLATFFNDLNIFNTLTHTWRSVTSPNSPLPRSGHCICASPHSGGTLWLFGGEFSSPKQNTFYHYNDFWSFECKSREWTRVEVKGKAPPARSGHRMVAWKGLVVLWGGFQDTSASTKYLGDLWVFNVVNYTWTQIVLPAHAQRPDARSSFSLLPHEQGAVLFGGYSKTKVTNAQKKGGKMAVSEMGNVHEDSWLLKLDQEDLSKIRWERRKKPGNAPNPKRVGVTMAAHKGRGIMFGGVHDKAETDEGLESLFFNEFFAWSVERNRFFPLVLRKLRQQKRVVEQRGGGGRRDRGRENEEELLRNLARLEAEQAGKSAEEIQEEEDRKNAEEERERLAALQQSELSLTLPSPRMHTALAVQDDVLYIYGGTFEKDDREICFDEMYAIDLGKLDGVRTIFSRQTEIEWVDSESEDEEDEDDEDDSEEEEEEAEEEVKKPKISEEELEARRTEKAKRKAKAAPISETPEEPAVAAEDQEEPEDPATEDPTPHPRPFESLREFFARTSNEWQQLLIEQSEAGGRSAMKTVKELRKDAFATAEEKWWACREEIRALEDEQEEAGIGEVVNLEDKAGAGGGVGRRR